MSGLLIPALAAAQPPADRAERIAAVEGGLSAAIHTEGEPMWTLAERMEAYDIPGLSVAVISDYQLDWARAYGVADSKTQRAVTTNTAFQAASISKTVNAIAQLTLVQEGRLALDQDINEVLTSWSFPYDERVSEEPITLYHLLTHTAGTSVHGFGGYRKASGLPTTAEIVAGQRPANSSAVKPIFVPGERFKYSGGGTTVSSLMLEEVTGQPFEQFVRETIIDPLGLAHTFYSVESDSEIVRAHAHTRSGRAIRNHYNTYPESAAAGFWTTPSDLAMLLIDHQSALAGDTDRVLTPETAAAMIVPDVAAQTAALGVFIESYGDTTYYSHSGANRGFRSQFYASVEGGDGVVVMVNSDRFDLISEVVRSVATVYGWEGLAAEIVPAFSLSEAQRAAVVGVYTSTEDPTRSLAVSDKRGQLMLAEKRRWQAELVATSPSQFRVQGISPRADVQFVSEDDGHVSQLVIHQGDKEHIWEAENQ